MITVYVKHYLTPQGLTHFENQWLPTNVKPIIEVQPGFVSIDWHIDKEMGCGHVTVKFSDDETLQQWVENPQHDVVDLLDPYRTKTYWEAARTIDENLLPEQAQWQRIEAKQPVVGC